MEVECLDLLLENGDLKKDSAGKPIPISGFDEIYFERRFKE